jgi:dipeptidyl aminopeptidase/acylaminoacyl peptidase
VFHGTGDKTVKFENSQAFTDKMKTNGNSCELVLFPDAPHSPQSSKEGEKVKIVRAKIEEESLKFLEKLGLVSPEQASAGAKATDKEEGE